MSFVVTQSSSVAVWTANVGTLYVNSLVANYNGNTGKVYVQAHDAVSISPGDVPELVMPALRNNGVELVSGIQTFTTGVVMALSRTRSLYTPVTEGAAVFTMSSTTTPQTGAGGFPFPDPIPGTGRLANYGNILAAPLLSDLTDLAGNIVFDGGATPSFTASGYNGEDVLNSQAEISGYYTTGGASTAHRIPVGTPLTYGFFVNVQGSVTNGFAFVSGFGGSINYGLVRDAGNNAVFEYIVAGGGTTPTSIPWYQGIWQHIAVRMDAAHTQAELLINGQVKATTVVTTNGVGGSDELFMFGGISSNQMDVWVRNAFIADSALTDAQILELAEDAHGHALPA